MRIILPVAVILKRFFAPRWVFSFFFGFVELRGIAVNPLPAGRPEPAPPSFHLELLLPAQSRQLHPYAFVCACAVGRGAAPAPFFGAKSATKTLPSMRGGVSIWPCSPISANSRVILARPTSWCAISRPR